MPESKNFETIISLPTRLTVLLQEFLHVNKRQWDIMVSKFIEEKELEMAWKANLANTGRQYRCSIIYREFAVRKGRGPGWRHIAAPHNSFLKPIQKKILRQFIDQIPVHFMCHGGQRGSGITTNAEVHVGHKHVFSVDIVNAFPSVFRSRMKAALLGVFNKRAAEFRGIKLTDEDRKMMVDAIIDMICLHDRLPQGPPTSPRMLNVVTYEMQKQLYELAMSTKEPLVDFRLTVYADDIVLSSKDEIPEWLRKKMVAVIEANGFITHTRKDKMTYYAPSTGKVPMVTGLLLTPDGGYKISPSKQNQLRALFYQAIQKPEWDKETYDHIQGEVAFLRQIMPDKVPSQLKKHLAAVELRIKAYRRGLPMPKGFKLPAPEDRAGEERPSSEIDAEVLARKEANAKSKKEKASKAKEKSKGPKDSIDETVNPVSSES